MKKLSLPAILILLFLFVSCQDKYIMPHTPGVTVDTEAFELYKNLWNSCGIKNYSYTYTLNRYPPLNFVVDVTVTNGDISYDLKEYNQLKDSEITEIDKSYFYSEIGDIKNLFLENVFNEIELTIEGCFEDYDKDPDCYYANFDFTFSDDAPFILYCKRESSLMKENIDGGSGFVEIKIENFVEN